VEAEAVAKIDLAPSTGKPLAARDRRVLPALCLGMFVVDMLTFVAPAPFFPAMARDLDVGVPLLGQVIVAMLLMSRDRPGRWAAG
jgi:hypothetical protein